MSLEFRGEGPVEEINFAVFSIYVEFEAMKLNEITNGGSVD